MKKALFLLSSVLLLSSCSLKYDENVHAEDKIPELVFQETKMTRYESNAVSLEMTADAIEQYKDSPETYAKKVEFSAYDNGELSTKGSCGLLKTNTDSKIYELYDDIKLFNQKEKVNFSANVLRWNENSEQLTSARGEMVEVQKEDASIRGTGFAASGVSKNFSFRGTVTGTIETNEKADSESPSEN